jgi:hypothetical protein
MLLGNGLAKILLFFGQLDGKDATAATNTLNNGIVGSVAFYAVCVISRVVRGVIYTHRDPASLRRRRKRKSQT